MEYERGDTKVLRSEGECLDLTFPYRHASVHVNAHRRAALFFFFFFALSTKSLLQKGESGQKTASLITLSSNLPLIFCY